jgi:geranylgeranyl pyrophosphate synthase
MWQKRQVKLLKEEVQAAISSLSNTPDFYNLVKESLTRTKYGLDSVNANEKPWPLLPLMVCEAISGRYEHALPAAAALHLIKVSAEIFDDIEDADSPGSLSARYGSASATNVATTFLVLAENAITRLNTRHVESDIVIRIVDIVNSSLATACIGQYLDLSLLQEKSVSEDIYLEVLNMKSAFITACACRVGALLAKANRQLIDTFTTFGQHLGMASQIANDILGITQGNDILKRKVTLPLIYALAKADNKTRSKLNLTFGKQSGLAPDTTLIKELLFNTGAIHYATIKMEVYKQKALDILLKAEKMKTDTKRLKLFLE